MEGQTLEESLLKTPRQPAGKADGTAGEAGGAAGATEPTDEPAGGVKAVLAKVLKFKTKCFPFPLNLQYLGLDGDQVLLSDSTHYMGVDLTHNYKSVVSSLEQYTIVTIYQATRTGENKKGILVNNMSVADTKFQTRTKVGNPMLLVFK